LDFGYSDLEQQTVKDIRSLMFACSLGESGERIPGELPSQLVALPHYLGRLNIAFCCDRNAETSLCFVVKDQLCISLFNRLIKFCYCYITGYLLQILVLTIVLAIVIIINIWSIVQVIILIY